MTSIQFTKNNNSTGILLHSQKERKEKENKSSAMTSSLHFGVRYGLNCALAVNNKMTG